MASKVQTDEIKERFKQFLRYSVRLVPVVVVVGAITWFFLLRSPAEQTNTSGTSGTKDTSAEAAADTSIASPAPETKVADNSATAGTKTGDSGKANEGKLPDTGPSDTLAIFAVTATAGTLFWEWRLRSRANKQN